MLFFVYILTLLILCLNTPPRSNSFLYSIQNFGAQTERPKTKRPTGQNVPRDKTSYYGTKRHKDKMSEGQNFPRDKTSQGTKRPKGKFNVTFVSKF